MKRLIVNADDFGLTPGINRAILELNRAHVLSSTTLMSSGGSFAAAVHQALHQPTLAVGCHVVLVDGTPVLPPAEIPSLIDPAAKLDSARFRPTVGTFLRDLLRGRIREPEIELEAAAQIRRGQAAGLPITHVDSHKHTHIFRSVLCPLLNAARQCGVSSVRNPFEPGWSIRATPSYSRLRRLQVRLLQPRRASFAGFIRRNGFATTDGAVGILATGTLDGETLRAILDTMPQGTWELVCHPGYQDDALGQVRTRLRASREVECTALKEVLPQRLAEDAELSLIDFGQL